MTEPGDEQVAAMLERVPAWPLALGIIYEGLTVGGITPHEPMTQGVLAVLLEAIEAPDHTFVLSGRQQTLELDLRRLLPSSAGELRPGSYAARLAELLLPEGQTFVFKASGDGSDRQLVLTIEPTSGDKDETG